MSVLTYHFESQYLKGNQEVTVILPDKPGNLSPAQFYQSGKRYKVLWLLHGTFGDATDWLRRTNIELYACEKDLVVVMPSALNSNYSNWDGFMMGFHMYDYLTEELMPLIYGWFPVSDRREDNFIAGLSMGGRGAIKYAVNHPDRFAAAAVLSAAPLDFSRIRPGHPCPLLNSEDRSRWRSRKRWTAPPPSFSAGIPSTGNPDTGNNGFRPSPGTRASRPLSNTGCCNRMSFLTPPSPRPAAGQTV